MNSGQRMAFLAAADKAHKKGKMPPQFLKHMKAKKLGPKLEGTSVDPDAVTDIPGTNDHDEDD